MSGEALKPNKGKKTAMTAGGDCFSCDEKIPKGECPKSKRPCGHHCNHMWTHDVCDWCGEGTVL